MLKRLLFPVKPDGTATSAILLIARIVFGILLMNHGIQKWTNFQELSAVFPDPLGVGSPLSLGLAIFGEIGMFHGIHYRFSLSFGYDTNGVYNGCCLFCNSWQ